MRGELLASLRERLRELTCAEAKLALALVTYAGPDGSCWPSTSTIARVLGCTDRHVRRLLASLARKGLIVRARETVEPTAGKPRRFTVTRIQAQNHGAQHPDILDPGLQDPDILGQVRNIPRTCNKEPASPDVECPVHANPDAQRPVRHKHRPVPIREVLDLLDPLVRLADLPSKGPEPARVARRAAPDPPAARQTATRPGEGRRRWSWVPEEVVAEPPPEFKALLEQLRRRSRAGRLHEEVR